MLQQKKFVATGLLILTILIVIFLASGISGVEFQPGVIAYQDEENIEVVPFKLPDISNTSWFYIFLCILWVALPVSIIFFIKYPEVRKRTLQGLMYVGIYSLILFLLSRKVREPPAELEEIEDSLVETTIIDTQRKASEFISSVAEADPNLNIILDIAILILIGILVWYLFQRFFIMQPSTSDQIKAEVDSAIYEIESGVDLRNVIVRCYMDMCQILADRRGIQREKTMTPREFELELQKLGFPQPAVQRLTRLFELVRYGNDQLDLAAEQEAIHCLTAIADSC
jgi:hypothetical protein